MIIFYKKVELSKGENRYFWPLKRVWKKIASQGKVSEKSGNLDMDIEWQPCIIFLKYHLPFCKFL